MTGMTPRIRRLSTQIFASQLAILAATMIVGFLLIARAERAHTDTLFESRAATIAESVTSLPAIRSCMATGGPTCPATIQNLATAVAASTGASYIVVIDMHGVRHSHPFPSLIGQHVTEPIVTADGRVHTGVDNGSTGRSANGKAPLYGPDGTMVGEVSAGIRESSVSSDLWTVLPTYAVWLAVALGIGAVASLALARRLKRRTFGLELDEIASLLQEREATLHGIREGVVALDESERVTVLNDEAQRLLGLRTSDIGSLLDDLIPAGRLRSALSAGCSQPDDVVVTDDFCLVINRMPVTLGGRSHGAVVTLRDRTEITGVMSELAGERSLTESLRAQQHEFANRMHVVAGLLELELAEEALTYVLEVRGTTAEFDETLRSHIGAPQVVGLLLGKAAEASERGIQLTVAPDTWLSDTPEKAQALATILGNLIDNAYDAVAEVSGHRWVELRILEQEDTMTITVTDNGPGVPADRALLIFQDGYTTKHRPAGTHGGVGLALVHRLVTRLGGSIEVSQGAGAQFTVRLPRDRATVPIGTDEVVRP